MKIKTRYRKADAEIPTSSTADIAFLLIVFFMVTTAFAATRGLNFNLPSDEKKDLPAKEEEAIYIRIHADESVMVDGRAMELDQILSYIAPKLERNRSKPVILHTDPEARYQRMIDVYDELSKAEKKIGIKIANVSIPTASEIREYIRLFGYNPFDVAAME